MSRRERLSEETERRYPLLWQFLGGYLHEDWPIFSGTPEKAVDQAISEYSVPLRQQVRRELVSLLERFGDDLDLRRTLNDGFGVNLYFREASEARAFAEDLERKLLESIRAHFQQHRAEGQTQ